MTAENQITQANTKVSKKKWSDYSISEKKESYLKYIVKEVAQAIKDNYAPFTKPIEQFERAYNPSNGMPFTTLNSLILDIKQKQHNYKENAWISLQDAKFLKADKSEIEAIFNNKDIPKVQTHYIKTFEIKPLYELDQNGNKIPVIDNNNNHVCNKNGELLYKLKLEPQIDRNGNIKYNERTGEPYMQFANEKIPVDPTLETRILYNIGEFKTIDKSRLKPINEIQEYKNRIAHKKDFDSINSPLIFQDLKEMLFPHTAGQILAYMKAQNDNSSYTPPEKGLNEVEKIQVERVVEKVLQAISENKNLATQFLNETPKQVQGKTQSKTSTPKNSKQQKGEEQTKSRGGR
ncbi:hypothetical protein BKH42_08625 [Helicobacter sp. 13S00482-2]|uniref:ArdC-like ssDNA-binding domain-containing protein n=1 Tax=Helicobacter sp. 13S00482-2 TaxID=1476200 RepID=UPI000BA688B0|nr:ArdC-like ssDNA-binding domain-containing protein [Helicobacter sp. 13S00482-2]PAF52947.1 hypothetical protein BKH42_08625 [Helicobacter sp. 13S00482-2]